MRESCVIPRTYRHRCLCPSCQQLDCLRMRKAANIGIKQAKSSSMQDRMPYTKHFPWVTEINYFKVVFVFVLECW